MTIDVLERPLLRGTLHAAVFFATVPAAFLLWVNADRAAGRAAAAIYGGALVLGFGSSAAYHRLARSARARRIMQRVDHAMIYVLIAGSYVPICMVALPPHWGIPLLSAVGAGAILGIVLSFTALVWAKVVCYVLYLVIGWAAVVAAPALLDNLSGVQIVLIAAGGITYTAGVPVLLLRRPDPWPRIFGYHEVWHLFTVVAAGLQFAAVTSIVSS
ncbi:MAG: hemolysin III family protein [Actinomycetota bacterium]|nr:hemolysin III family protein [Actinomycetota bacterium]